MVAERGPARGIDLVGTKAKRLEPLQPAEVSHRRDVNALGTLWQSLHVNIL